MRVFCVRVCENTFGKSTILCNHLQRLKIPPPGGPTRPVYMSLRVTAANVRLNLPRDSGVEPGRVVGAADCAAPLIVVRLRRRGLVAARGTCYVPAR